MIVAVDAGGVLFPMGQRTPMVGAKEGLETLKKLGVELHLVSFAGRQTAIQTAKDIKLFFPGLFTKQFYVKNKLEKLAVCRHVGACILIDDTWDILETLFTGLNLGKQKEILPMETIVGFHFNSTSNALDLKEALETEQKCKIVKTSSWAEVIAWTLLLQPEPIQPDEHVYISRFVYGDLCDPPIVAHTELLQRDT